MSAKYKQFPSGRFVLGILLLIKCCCFSVALDEDMFAKCPNDIEPGQQGYVEISDKDEFFSLKAVENAQSIGVYSKESDKLSFTVVHPEFNCEPANKDWKCGAKLIYDTCTLEIDWLCSSFKEKIFKQFGLEFKNREDDPFLGLIKSDRIGIDLAKTSAEWPPSDLPSPSGKFCSFKGAASDSSEFEFKHNISFELTDGTCDAKLEFKSDEYKILAITTTTTSTTPLPTIEETSNSSAANSGETTGNPGAAKADFPTGAIIGIVIAAIVIVLVIAGGLYWYFCIQNKEDNGDSIEEGRTDVPNDFIVPDKLSNTPIETNVPSITGMPKTPDTTEKKKADKKKDAKEPSSANKSGKKKDKKISPKKDAKN